MNDIWKPNTLHRGSIGRTERLASDAGHTINSLIDVYWKGNYPHKKKLNVI